MSNSIEIQPTNSIQKFYVCSNSLKSLIAHHDQLFMRRGKIENDDSLSHRQKERQLAVVDSELDNLKFQIENLQKKEDYKEQEKQQEILQEILKDSLESTVSVNTECVTGVCLEAEEVVNDYKTVEPSEVHKIEEEVMGKLFDKKI